MKNLVIVLIILVSVAGIVFWGLKQTGSENKLSGNQGAALTTPKVVRPTEPESLISPTVNISPTKTPVKSNKIGEPPSMQIDTAKTYTAILKTTDGDITISLNAKETPITANNFVSLSRDKFYDNTIFHRVINGFMIQGGDPNGNGSGGPGYKFADEPFTGEYTRGTVAMANSGPNTNGSQFFIMHADSPLPKNYVIFGNVVAGMDAVDKIAEAPVTANSSGEQSKPITPVKITSVEIVEK